MNGERKMLYVAVKWKDGTVTHRTYNDLYVLEKQYTETEIREIYKNNPDVEYINIDGQSVFFGKIQKKIVD